MKKSAAELDAEKKLAATAALKWVRDGMKLGLGTGSTSAHFIRALAQWLKENNAKVEGVATSQASAKLAAELGITVLAPQRGLKLDLAVDGADEIGPKLALTKGGGGALLKEKVVACASSMFLVIADSDKPRAHLGAFPLPLEVIPFCVPWILDWVADLGGNPKVREREGQEVLSDQGNNLIDCSFGIIQDPEALAEKLGKMPGVAEHGLFLGLAAGALVADGDKVRLIKPDGSEEPVTM